MLTLKYSKGPEARESAQGKQRPYDAAAPKGDPSRKADFSWAGPAQGPESRLPALGTGARQGRFYLGLSCTYHDPAVAIVNEEGEVLFAEASERHLQNKRALGSPPGDFNRMAKLIATHCGPEAELVLARSWRRRWFLKERLTVRAVTLLRRLRDLKSRLVAEPADPLARSSPDCLKMVFAMPEFFWRSQIAATEAATRFTKVQGCLLNRGLNNRMAERAYDHHLTHAVAACLSSPFEQAVCAVVDGYGEGTSTAYYRYAGGHLTPVYRLGGSSQGSLGAFYQMVCELCGFESLQGEEWKVMGLASYGKRDETVYRLLRPLIRVEGLRIHSRYVTRGFDAIRRRPSEPPIRAADLAHTGQRILEEVLAEVLRNLRGLDLSENLVFTGGCALNSTFNGKVLELTGFKRLHVPCAPADDGNALGAAWCAWREDHPGAAWRPRQGTPYLGSTFSATALKNVTQFAGLEHIRELDARGMCEAVAGLLAQGKIVAWARGRAEFGPRALGSRSILADPRFPDARDRINANVKFREEFRPFAPSILHEHGPAYFENYQFSPYMERTLRFRDEVKAIVPGVVHVDGTGRLQSVTAALNGEFHALLKAFHARTGVPVLLNTSFNVMGKPIVHSVEDALSVFFTSGIDALALETLLILKEPRPPEATKVEMPPRKIIEDSQPPRLSRLEYIVCPGCDSADWERVRASESAENTGSVRCQGCGLVYANPAPIPASTTRSQA